MKSLKRPCKQLQTAEKRAECANKAQNSAKNAQSAHFTRFMHILHKSLHLSIIAPYAHAIHEAQPCNVAQSSAIRVHVPQAQNAYIGRYTPIYAHARYSRNGHQLVCESSRFKTSEQKLSTIYSNYYITRRQCRHSIKRLDPSNGCKPV